MKPEPTGSLPEPVDVTSEDLSRSSQSGPAVLQLAPAVHSSAAELTQGWLPPERIAEYQRVRLLGEGAMGQVYLYQDLALARPVAIKFLSANNPTGSATRAQSSQQRFETEARAIARLSHPNVLTVFRVGEVDGCPFLVSEFAAGGTLEGRALPLPAAQVRRYAMELAQGLAAAHRAGVLHRDIKPANVFLNGEGRAKLGDFGLAKLQGPSLATFAGATEPGQTDPAPGDHGAAADGAPPLLGSASASAGPALTQTGAMMGTPLYMAPEAWLGEPPAPPMDVYSLGVLLYELSVGHTPFTQRNIHALGWAVMQKDPPSLTGSEDPALAAIIDRCLRRDPAQRYTSGVELCAALEEPVTLAAAEDARAAERPRPRRGLVLLGATAVVLALAAVAGLAARGRPPRAGMARLAGGSFRMGSTAEEIEAAFHWCASESTQCERAIYERERPARQVTLSPFLLDRVEVTNQAFAAWLSRRPGLRLVDDRKPPAVPARLVYEGETLLADLYPAHSGIERQSWGRGFRARLGLEMHPVILVTWDAAQRYCQAQGQRLPTEAEWEFAARAQRTARFPWGHDVPGCREAVFGRKPGSACAGWPQGTAEVGSGLLDRTQEGVWDLAGNVAEWVADRFTPSYPPCGACANPVLLGKDTDAHAARVIRGGSWNLPASVLRSAARSQRPPEQVATTVGFRCAADAR